MQCEKLNNQANGMAMARYDMVGYSLCIVFTLNVGGGKDNQVNGQGKTFPRLQHTITVM